MTDDPDQHVPAEHLMVHEGESSSGAEEWHCPTCGRTVVVRWEPEFEQLVLVEGDTRAAHAGSRHGGVRLRPPARRPATPAPDARDPDARDPDARESGARESGERDSGARGSDVRDDGDWARWLADHGIGPVDDGAGPASGS